MTKQTKFISFAKVQTLLLNRIVLIGSKIRPIKICAMNSKSSVIKDYVHSCSRRDSLKKTSTENGMRGTKKLKEKMKDTKEKLMNSREKSRRILPS